MFFKFFSSRLYKPESVKKPLTIKIIHAGGLVESYHIPFPASWIMEKYPNFILARPNIFRRPWDSVVPPDEVLVPGQKYFLVPIPTVKKLRRRMKKPNTDMSSGFIRQDKDTASCSGSLSVSEVTRVSRGGRFMGIESETSDASVVDDLKKKKKKKKKKNPFEKGSRKKNERFTPSLKMINETEGSEY